MHLKKLGLNSALDLLKISPKGYENHFPITDFTKSQEASEFIKINAIRKSQNVTQISAIFWDEKKYAPKNDITLIITLFKPKPWVFTHFTPQKILKIYGDFKFSQHIFEITHPKISNFTGIRPIFGIKNMQDKIILRLCLDLLPNALADIGIKESLISDLMQIYEPDLELFNYFKLHKSLPKQHIYAQKFIEIYIHISNLRSKKRDFKAKLSAQNSPEIFIKFLPFELTNDQKRVISQIHADLSSKKAARRMIVGDVGCGKTIIILASAFMMHPKKSLLMAPTTILARQIFEEAKMRLSHMKIALITGENKADFSDCDFVIGTQALLHRKFDASDFGLLMIDEQHRFGTKQRAFLSKMLYEDHSGSAHFLQFSATPIPRTLGMINQNLIDFSFIKELPFPKNIDTKIISKGDFGMLLAHIRSECQKGYQSIIVYPLVEQSNSNYKSLNEAKAFWEAHFPRVFATHGNDKNKDKILQDFAKDGEILLTTTLIEVGISLPRLSTIAISRPENLGLATLHQLRGRVSRNGILGHCFLITEALNSKRLNEFSKTLDGFLVAELDLKYRSSGDLLNGQKQSGREFSFFDVSEDKDILEHAQKALNQTLEQDAKR
ncbi:MAG: ATP-dependent DNA helicase RecG [Helicobacter sp.]|nr:ATP-dependent DNA helicase RecG [Helicobacter sp.]